MESAWRDIRQAFRMMSEHKAFSAGVLLTPALGIGANTAMFSIARRDRVAVAVPPAARAAGRGAPVPG
jgi:hypothetical protein